MPVIFSSCGMPYCRSSYTKQDSDHGGLIRVDGVMIFVNSVQFSHFNIFYITSFYVWTVRVSSA